MANQWDEKTWKINIIAGKPAERISGPKIKGILGEIFEIFLVNSGVRRKSLPSPHGMFSYWAIQFKCFLSSRQVACRKGAVALNFFYPSTYIIRSMGSLHTKPKSIFMFARDKQVYPMFFKVLRT